MSQQPAPWSQPPASKPNPTARPGSGPADNGVASPTATHGTHWNQPAPGPVPSGVPPERTRTLAFHRLGLADRRHRWWKPLVEGALLIVFFLILSVLFTIPMLAFMGPMFQSGVENLDQLDPLVFLYIFGSVVLMAPAAYAARLIMGPRPLGLLHSVTGRLRWKWLLQCLLAALIIFVVVNGLSVLLDLVTGAATVEIELAPQWGWLLLMVVLLVPLQCFAEELVFRGYLMQTFGRWLKHPVWAIILPVPLFVLGHLYDVWGQTSIAIMAITMGVITWRTGGLEAAVALHVVNNCAVTLMGMVGLVDLNDTSGGPVEVLFTLIVNGLFLLVVFWMARKTRIATSRTVILPPPPQLPALAQRPRAVSENGAQFAAFVVDPRTRNYLSLPERYGPYTVHDGQGRPVGLLDVRAERERRTSNGSVPPEGHQQPPHQGSVSGDAATTPDRTP